MKLKAVSFLSLALCAGLAAQTKPASTRPRSAAPAKAAPATTIKPAAGSVKAPAAVATSAPATPAATPDNPVVLTIGDEKITAKEFDSLIESLPEQYRAQARGPMKRQMAEQIARVKLLASEARKRGLDKDEALKSRLHFQEENLLAGAAYNDFMKNAKVDDAALHKYFDEHKNEFETVQARHILIKFKGSPVPAREGKQELSEEQALAKVQEIRKQLVAGSDFAALAKAESDDVGSGANGGDLGNFGHGQMVPAFDEAAFKLPVGEISEPIKTQFGYHLIQVQKHDTKSFDSVKSELEQKLRPEAARESVENLRKSVPIKLEASYFGPDPAAAPAGGIGAAPAGAAPAPAVK